MAKAYKQQHIDNFFKDKNNYQFSTVKLSSELNVSLPTLLQYIKNNIYSFTKVGSGEYSYSPPDTASYSPQNIVQNQEVDTTEKPPIETALKHIFEQLGLTQQNIPQTYTIPVTTISEPELETTQSNSASIVQPKYYEW